MAAKVPMKVRVAIRDDWTNEDSAIQTGLRRVGELLGVPIVVEPDWGYLFKELGPEFDDVSELAQSIIGCTAAWLRSLVDLLDGDYYPEFNQALAKQSKSNGKCQVLFEIPDPHIKQPDTSYSNSKMAFLISLPRGTFPAPTDMVSIFMAALPESIKEEEHLAPVASRPAPAREPEVEEQSNAPPAETTAPRSAPPPSHAMASAPLPVAKKGGYTYIPDVKSMQKPDDLLLKPPYYLIVYANNRESVEVECSHSPTLQMLSEYLKKWVKTNQEDRRKNPVVGVYLFQAAFGLGLTYDRLMLRVDKSSDNNYFLVTPTVILSLVEGMLGYERVSVQGCVWTFRKDTELRKF